jgi:hypothetical protein
MSNSNEVVSNRFTPETQRLIAKLRAIEEEFIDVSEKPLTPMEIRLARHTSPAALERAAVFVESMPGIAGVIEGGINPNELREAIYYELAYGGVRDIARYMAINIDHAIMRRKLKAVKIARALYKIAKSYATLDAADPVRPYVENLKQSLVRPRRRKSTPAE